MSHTPLQEWERAEIRRSTSEASHTSTRALRTSPENIQRYLAPPGDTPYPLEYVFHLLGDVRGLTVLDFGCGSGLNTLMLAHRGARVLAFDISESLVRLARERLERHGMADKARCLVASAHELPLREESVDVVLGAAILHHLDLDTAVRETRRVLRPGGRAIFQEPVRSSRLLRIVRRLIPYRQRDVSPFERPLTGAEVSRLARLFSRARIRAFGLPHVRIAEVIRCSDARLRRAYQLDRRALDRFPRLATYAAIRVIELEK